MDIRTALIDKDEFYAERFRQALLEFYPQAELYVFTDTSEAERKLSEASCDVVLISRELFETIKEPKSMFGCETVVVLADEKDTAAVGNMPAICRYRSIDDIYSAMKKALPTFRGTGSTGRDTSLITFITGAGGCGCTAAAAAYAQHTAVSKKVLYIDMDMFSAPERIFGGSGRYTLADCISALKNYGDTENRLISYAASGSGVYFYCSPHDPLENCRITPEDKILLLETLIGCGYFDCIVAEAEHSFNKLSAWLTDNSEKVYVISDPTWDCMEKNERLVKTISAWNKEKGNTSRLAMISTRTGRSKPRKQGLKKAAELPEVQYFNDMSELVRKLSAEENWNDQ